MKIGVQITGAIGEYDERVVIPKAFEDVTVLWAENQDKETGIKVIEVLNTLISAEFLFDNVDGLDELAQDSSDLMAEEVLVSSFDFEDGLLVPVVKVTAIFDVPFNSDVTSEELIEWESQSDDPISFAASFYWDFEEPIYLDTHSGAELLLP